MSDVKISQQTLDLAVAAYNAEPGEQRGMTAALTAANLYTPANLKVALDVFRPRILGIDLSMCAALAAVLEQLQ